MSERQYIFTVEELQTLSCKCPKCGNQIIFSLLTDERYGIPSNCATCSEPLDQLAKALKEYRDFARTVARSGLPIRLHTKPTVADDL